MLPQSIINMIRAKYGKDEIYSADCERIADKINNGHPGPIVSTSTIKRLLGFAGTPETNPTPRTNTLDIVAQWLGYDNYKGLLREIGEHDYSSEFTVLESIDVIDLDEGTQIQIKYEPSRVIVMTYLGGGQFLINESKNSKLLKGDRIKLTHLVLGQEMITKEVIRDGKNLGGYRAAKDGGLTSLEIIA